MSLSDEELLRYSRQIMLPVIDIAGQEALNEAVVLVVGLGGLGSPVSMYLAASGVGHLVLCDADKVDLSNLQRQVAHGTGDVGRAKTESAAATLQRLNPAVAVTLIEARLEGDVLEAAVASADVVIDCTDNFTTRFALNRACFAAGVPLVSGAAIRFEGQLSVFDPRKPASPCYACLYSEGEDVDLNCSENGVVAPLTGIIGSYQALEAIKLITMAGTPLTGRLLLLDALAGETRILNLKKKPGCPVCSVQASDRHFETEGD